jgi:hypothetical protein
LSRLRNAAASESLTPGCQPLLGKVLQPPHPVLRVGSATSALTEASREHLQHDGTGCRATSMSRLTASFAPTYPSAEDLLLAKHVQKDHGHEAPKM